MGLLKASLVLILAYGIVEYISHNKQIVENVPILNSIITYLDGNKAYLVIFSMFLILTLI